MYGQTNAWALPDGDYAAFRGMDGEVYVMTDRSALNLSYQASMPWWLAKEAARAGLG
jgi:leucyl-tRNA synthetase